MFFLAPSLPLRKGQILSKQLMKQWGCSVSRVQQAKAVQRRVAAIGQGHSVILPSFSFGVSSCHQTPKRPSIAIHHINNTYTACHTCIGPTFIVWGCVRGKVPIHHIWCMRYYLSRSPACDTAFPIQSQLWCMWMVKLCCSRWLSHYICLPKNNKSTSCFSLKTFPQLKEKLVRAVLDSLH